MTKVWLNNFTKYSKLSKQKSLFIHDSSKICWLSWSFLSLASLTFTRRKVKKKESHLTIKVFLVFNDRHDFILQHKYEFLFSFPLFFISNSISSHFGSFSWAMMTIFKGSWEKMNDIWWRCEITFSIISIVFLSLSFFPSYIS